MSSERQSAGNPTDFTKLFEDVYNGFQNLDNLEIFCLDCKLEKSIANNAVHLISLLLSYSLWNHGFEHCPQLVCNISIAVGEHGW